MSNVLDQVFFIVTEKDDVLGQICIPVTSLKAFKGQAKRMPLQPHKKCPTPTGELIYQCYVSKYRAVGDHLPIIRGMSQSPDYVQPKSAFQRLRKRIASPVTHRRARGDFKNEPKPGSLSSFNKKFSRSIQDLFSFSKFSAGESINIDDNESINSKKSNSKKDKNKRKFSLSFLSVSNDLDRAGDAPEITRCVPNSGPIDHPTRLTIEGHNLGVGKSDILSLKVAGCDCTDTLEFVSSSLIHCTTHFWKVGKGAVIIDTVSGGIGTLHSAFSFYEEADANDDINTNAFENGVDDNEVANGEVDETEHIDFSIGGRQIEVNHVSLSSFCCYVCLLYYQNCANYYLKNSDQHTGTCP